MLLFIKKLIKVLRGGAGGREIMLGLALGIMLGMVPGLNLVTAIFLFAVLILNANFAIVMLGLLFGKIACHALAPVTFGIGFNLIHGMGLEGLVQACSKAPVLAWLGLDKYCLVGGLPIGIVGGIVAGILFAKSITKVREKLVAAKNDSEKFQALLKKWYVKFFVKIFAGKTKADMEETLGKESKLFRKSGVIVAVAGLVILIVAELLVFKFGARVGLEKALGYANGAEVNVEAADISIFGGKIDVKGLQVTDADKPANNAFQAERLAADFSVKELLRKRLVIELMAVDGLAMDATRETPGKVFEDEESRKKRKEREAKEKEKADREKMTTEDMISKVSDVIENWDTYKSYASKAKAVVERGLAVRRAKKQILKAGGPKGKLKYLKAKAKKEGYLKLSANEWNDEATFVVKRVQSGGHEVAKILPKQSFVLTNVSSAPELSADPMTLAMEGPEGAETVAVSVKLGEDLGAKYEVRGALTEVKLNEAELSGDVGEMVEGGLASAKATGSYQGGTFDLPFSLTVKDLQIQPKSDQKVLGMNADTAKQVFAALDAIELEGQISGTLDSPSVSVDLDKLQKSLFDALEKVGKEMLAKRVKGEIDKAKKMAATRIKEEKGKALAEFKAKIRKEFGDDVADQVNSENFEKLKVAYSKLSSDDPEERSKARAEFTSLAKDKAKDKAKDEADKAIAKEVAELKDKVRAKYGDEIASQIGPDNYKMVEGLLNKINTGNIIESGKALKKLMGLGKGKAGEDEKEKKKKPFLDF